MNKKNFEKFLILTAIITLILSLFLIIFHSLDIKILSLFLNNKNQIIESIMLGVSELSNFLFLLFLFMIFLAISLYQKKNIIKMSSLYLLNVVGIALISNILKELFQRIRPLNIENTFSFPSSHASISFVAYGILAYLLHEKNPISSYFIFIFPILIGISRIYLGAHWLSDILFGFFISSVWLLIVINTFKERGSLRREQ